MIFQMICSLMKRETNAMTVSNAFFFFIWLFLLLKMFLKREGEILPIFARAILVDNLFFIFEGQQEEMETSDFEGEEADATEPEDESTEQGDEEMDEKGEQGETKMEDEENIDGKDKEEDGENSKVGRLPINVRKETSLRTSIRKLKLITLRTSYWLALRLHSNFALLKAWLVCPLACIKAIGYCKDLEE